MWSEAHCDKHQLQSIHVYHENIEDLSLSFAVPCLWCQWSVAPPHERRTIYFGRLSGQPLRGMVRPIASLVQVLDLQ